MPLGDKLTSFQYICLSPDKQLFGQPELKMSSIEWYEDLFSKVNGTEFDRNGIPDSFKVKIHDGDKVFASWDITEELHKNGMTRLNYTNETLNLDVEFIFMHEELFDKFRDDNSLNKILESALNDSSEFDFEVETSGKSRFLDETGLLDLHAVFISQAVITLILGVLGLVFKVRNPSEKAVTKVAKLSTSVWCLTMGILMIVFEFCEYQINNEKDSGDKSAHVFFSAISNIFSKILLMSLKMFTAIIYSFENLLIFLPFFFRKHRKRLSKLFLAVSFGQLLVFSSSFMAWSFILIYGFDTCEGLRARSQAWEVTVMSLTLTSYVISLILCCTFLSGYWKSQRATSKLGKSRSRSMKKTMINCFIEIVFDICTLAVIFSGIISCFSFDLKSFHLDQLIYSPSCDLAARIIALDTGIISSCSIKILILQPAIQEIVFLVSELIRLSRNF